MYIILRCVALGIALSWFPRFCLADTTPTANISAVQEEGSPYGHWPPKAGDSAVLYQKVSPDGKWRLINADYWTEGGDENLHYGIQSVVCSLMGAKDTVKPKDVVQNDSKAILLAMEINDAIWSSNSRYCLFSARHSGGHSPWNDPAYLVDVKTMRLYPVEAVTGTIVDPAVSLDQMGNISVFVGSTDENGNIDFDKRLKKTVSIEQVLKAKPIGRNPSWIRPWQPAPTKK